MLTIEKGKSGWSITTFVERCRLGIYSTLYINVGRYHVMWTRKVEDNERKRKTADEGADERAGYNR